MAATGMSFLLDNLRDLVVFNADLFTDQIQDDINALCDDLYRLEGFLNKCTEERYSDDDFLAGLTKKIRHLIFRAEDAIENHITLVSKQKYPEGKTTSSLYKINDSWELHNSCKELESLKQEVRRVYKKEMTNRFLVMSKIDKRKGKANERTVRKYPVDFDMVGFEDAMGDVIGYLTEGPNDLQTVSIVGMLGLGKTTLARKVVEHPTVEYHFFIRVFIEVSQDFKRKEVLLKLVQAFGNIRAEVVTRMDEDDLWEATKSYLDKRNYLIVLDDVWTVDVWNQLKGCFSNNQKHSRVLITTQNMDVALHARQGSQFKPYRLRFLNHQEGRELLRKRVFGQTDTIRLDLEEHELAILDRCDGLPLAIVAAADILREHREETSSWIVAVKEEIWNLFDKVDHAIKLSFNQLSYPLKLCFLYLGVFRDDFQIPSRTLYQLWVSEGLVPPDDEKGTSEDKAKSYLEHLVSRSLVMVEKKKFNGRIKTVRIHDTLRKFCKMQALDEALFREIKFGEGAGIMSSDDDRRLCINSKVREYITCESKQTGKFVRSFLSFAKEDYTLPPEYILEIPKAFKFLKVLDVRSIRFTQFPIELFYMFLLKYIAMCSDLKIIPIRISNLRYLQTLIFNTTQRSIEIKADIWKMKQLRHLETNASTSLLKTKEALTTHVNLQTLSTISPESCTPEIFHRAQKLKKLGVRGELAPFMKTLFHSVSKLECLENLKLLNATATFPLKSLPDGNEFPPKLTRLTLQNTMLSWEWMCALAKLKNLEMLKLKENAFIGGYWDTESTGCFSALKVLHIEKTDLITWKASEDHFPHLTHLYLRHCTMLKEIPTDLVNVSTLKLIDIYCCKPEVANYARKLVLPKLQVQAQKDNEESTQLKLFIYPSEQ